MPELRAGAIEPRTLAPPRRRSAAVLANDELGAYRLMRVLDGDGLPAPHPGQFYMLATADGWGGGDDQRPYLPRAFSFARALEVDGGAELQFLLEAVGPGTERLAAVRPGEQMNLTGPLGVGFRPPAAGGTAVLVAGGIGVAPILCWHDQLGPAVPLLLGFRSAHHARAAELFRGEPLLATDDGSAGRHGLVTELLLEQLDGPGDVARTTVYACGPPQMLEAVRAICAERRVSVQLALESGMACGYGACFGCVVWTRGGYLRLCLDGPVIDGAALESALIPGAGH